MLEISAIAGIYDYSDQISRRHRFTEF